MIVYRFKNIKTGVTYEDALSRKDVQKLLDNKNIIMQPIRIITHGNKKR